MADAHPISISDELIQLLRSARSLTVLTGAGISAESGIPTFRDLQTGLWAKYNPQELATPDAFEKNPGLVFDWYRWRHNLVTQAKPNAGHYAIAAFEKHVPTFTLVTQNVDGLHQKAGSKNVIELHGSLQRLRCTNVHCGYTTDVWSDEPLPHCPVCDANLRPDVVWFGEMLPPDLLKRAVSASKHCDLFFSIGTSSVVEPAASLPYEALHAGVPVVEVNLEPTSLNVYAKFYCANPAAEILPQIVSSAWSG